MIKYTLGKSFGPVGSSAGLFVFIAGLAITYFSPVGLFLFGLGAFLSFSKSTTRIDCGRKRIKFSTDVFGIFSTGHWIDVQAGMYVKLERINKTWRSFSRGNRPLDIAVTGYCLYLYGSDNEKILPIMYTCDYQSAKDAKENLLRQLGLTTSL